MEFNFNEKITKQKLREFAQLIRNISDQIGFKVSARGWCYLMEQGGYINKDQFNKVETAINRCRKEGLLPVDFVAEEDARAFKGVESESSGTIEDMLRRNIEDVIDGHSFYTPDWWEGEDYYIQVVVEKIDLVTLFRPVCKDYHIPIANAKGWSSILQRAEYAKRFKEAEERGMKCVLLYCGDHDPDGLRISDTLRKNLQQVSEVFWNDGSDGYDPSNLEIQRFGLNYDFIQQNKYSWIENLITGSGKDLASPNHKNYRMPYVQQYLKKVGARKCEANAVVTTPDVARQLMRDTIEAYVGKGAIKRFEKKRKAVENEYKQHLDNTGLLEPIERFLYGDEE